MTAEKVTAFKKTVIFYPLCIAAIWLPSVFLGLVAADRFPGLKPGESDDVILRLLTANTGVVVAGVLGAAIMACVMATDSQILALGTMFTEDIVSYYAGAKRLSESTVVWTGRAFVVIRLADGVPTNVTTVLRAHPSGTKASSADYATAALADDGSCAVAYLPTPRTFTGDLARLKAPVTVRGFDPASGRFQNAPDSPVADAGKRDFTPSGKNAAGESDWLLVLQSERAGSTRP